jgi:fumarate hydratase class II
VIARNLLESIRLLANVSNLFVAKCLEGIQADRKRARALLEGSMVMVTALAPVIGHDAAAQLAEESLSTGRSVRELCLERELVAPKELESLLDLHSQTQPRP